MVLIIISAAEETSGQNSSTNGNVLYDEEYKATVRIENEARKISLASSTRRNQHEYQEERRKTNKILKIKKRNSTKQKVELTEKDFKNENIRGTHHGATYAS